MGEVLILRIGDKTNTSASGATVVFTSFNKLLIHLFQKGGLEADATGVTTISIDESHQASAPNTSKLDDLEFKDKHLLLSLIFGHRNISVNSITSLESSTNIDTNINTNTDDKDSSISKRIIRVQTWTGTCEEQKQEPIWTMSGAIIKNLGFQVPPSKLSRLIELMELEIDFFEVLGPLNKSRICKLVGFWEFPAHELLNNELAYCVYAMLNHAQKEIDQSIQISPNNLLMLVILTRDTYKAGNPFHNFRHATDVLQACFYFLVKLGCLHEPQQFLKNPLANELVVLDDKDYFDGNEELVKLSNDSALDDLVRSSNLGALASLALLVAALGHDSGHPGVTNAFMTKYNSPTSRVYNGKLVLESFHASLFSQLILSHCWPKLLKTELEGSTVAQFISQCILATDMAEHFEYVSKISGIGLSKILTASLLIKCADILNVTRPLRVSSQWALVLSREFEEVSQLEKLIAQEGVRELDPKYTQLPRGIDEILKVKPDIHKGQLFFINTFAESLFGAIATHLPEIAYTCEIITQNKEFWLSRNV